MSETNNLTEKDILGQSTKDLLNLIPAGIIQATYGHSPKVIYLNKAAKAVYYKALNSNLIEVVHPNDRKYFNETIDNLLSKKSELPIGMRLIKNNGSVFWLKGSASIVDIGDDKKAIQFVFDIENEKNNDNEKVFAKAINAIAAKESALKKATDANENEIKARAVKLEEELKAKVLAREVELEKAKKEMQEMKAKFASEKNTTNQKNTYIEKLKEEALKHAEELKVKLKESSDKFVVEKDLFFNEGEENIAKLKASLNNQILEAKIELEKKAEAFNKEKENLINDKSKSLTLLKEEAEIQAEAIKKQMQAKADEIISEKDAYINKLKESSARQVEELSKELQTRASEFKKENEELFAQKDEFAKKLDEVLKQSETLKAELLAKVDEVNKAKNEFINNTTEKESKLKAEFEIQKLAMLGDFKHQYATLKKSLTNEKNNLINSNELLHKEKEALLARKTILENKQAEIVKKNEELEAKLVKTEEEYNSEQGKTYFNDQEIAELKEKIELIEQDNSRLFESKKAVVQEKEALTEENKILASKLEKTTSDSDTLKIVNEKVQAELNEKIAITENNNKSILKEKEIIEARNKVLLSEKEALIYRSNNDLDKIKKLKEEKDSLVEAKKELVEQETNLLSQIDSLTLKASKLETEKEEGIVERENLREKITELQIKIDEINNNKEELLKLEESNSKNEKIVFELTEEKTTLETKVKELIARNNDLIIAKASLLEVKDKVIADGDVNLKMAKAKISLVESSFKEKDIALNNEIFEKTGQINKLKNNIKELKTSEKLTENVIEKLLEVKYVFVNERADLLIQFEEKNKQIGEDKEIVEALNKQIAKDKEVIDETTKQIIEDKETIEAIRKELLEAKLEKANADKKLEELRLECEELQAANKKLVVISELANEKYDKLKEEFAMNETELGLVEEDLASMAKEKLQMEDEAKSLKAGLFETQSKLDQTSIDFEKVRFEKDELSKNAEALQELEAFKETEALKEKQFLAEKEAWQMESTKLAETIRNSEEKVKTLTEEVNDLATKNKNFLNEIELVKAENEQTKGLTKEEIAKYNKKLKDAKTEAKLAENTYDKLLDAKYVFISNKYELEKKVQELEASKNELGVKQEVLKNHNQELIQELEEYKAKNIDYKKQLSEFKHGVTEEEIKEKIEASNALARRFNNRVEFNKHKQSIISETRNACFASEVNFFKNKLVLAQGRYPGMDKPASAMTYTGFLEYVRDNFVVEEELKKFEMLLNNKALKDAVNDGKSSIACEYKSKRENSFIWLRMTIYLMVEPVTRELQGFVRVQNINHEKLVEEAAASGGIRPRIKLAFEGSDGSKTISEVKAELERVKAEKEKALKKMESEALKPFEDDLKK